MLGTETDLTADLYVRNIGGIDETTIKLEPGICILSGQNATNRTSLLKSIMAVLGSEKSTMKSDADEAEVELSIGDETYTRRFERRDGTVHATGEPYLKNSTPADLFAFLIESNAARQTAMTGENLRDLIMQPVDTQEINAEIEQLLKERQEISEELDELGELKRKLPPLEQERTRIQGEIDNIQEKLNTVETKIQEKDTEVEQKQKEQTELEEKFEELKETRSQLDDIRYELETEQDRLESLQNKKAELQQERKELAEVPSEDIEQITSEIRDLRSRKQQFEDELNDVQGLVAFNEEMLKDDADQLFNRLEIERDTGGITADLLEDENITCWTCGTEVKVTQIEETIDKLQILSKETRKQISELDSKLDELSEQKENLQHKQRRSEDVERRIEEVKGEIDNVESRIDDLRHRQDSLNEVVEAAEKEIEELETDTHDEILELHKEANQLEYKLGSLETDLERVEDNITSIEAQLERENEFEQSREEIQESIKKLRTRIERIEKEIIEEFNEHMDTVLELLEYKNIERIWLERVETEVRNGRQTVTETKFEIHIVRKTQSGTTYEDEIMNLSESEREVIGLNFALAGYLVHNVYERVPFMLLDSLETIDRERISALVEYFSDYSSYLVVALLSEDAAALDDSHQYIREI